MESNQKYVNECKAFLYQLQKDTDTEMTSQQFLNLKQNQSYPQPFLLYLKEIFHLSDIQFFLMLYAYTYEIDSEINSYVWQNTKARYLSLGIILSLYSKMEKLLLSDFKTCTDVIDQGILFYRSDPSYLFMREIRLQHFVFYYLNSGCLSETDILKIHDPSHYTFIPLYAEENIRLLHFMQQGMSCCICGDLHTGRKSLVMQCCQQLQLFAYHISIQAWLRCTKVEQEELLSSLLFYRMLQNGIVLVEDVSNEFMIQVAYIKKRIEEYKLQLIVIVEDEKIFPLPSIVIPPFLNPTDMHLMSNALWGKNWSLLQQHLTPDELIQLKKNCPDGEGISTFLDQNRQVCESPFYNILNCPYHLENWLGDKKLKSQLSDLISYIHNKEKIHTFLQKDKLGCTVLLHGPSGTGKTMAATIIGRETHLPVWQINLSMILDKYIGESEKHLQEIFLDAQKHNCILLFDEADILFARRTSIASSNDRYANTSTAYLLQELESYSGIVLLTSNLLTNFDDAFLRRIRFILHFPSPNETIKKEKWEQCFQQVPLEDGFDSKDFAKHFNLSLAQIENVYENAVCYWIQDGTPTLKREHFYKALKQEYQKRMEAIPEYMEKMI